MEIWQVNGTTVQIKTESVDDEFAYNPETDYILLPASVYGSLSGDQIQELKSEEYIEGIYNNDCINPVRI